MTTLSTFDRYLLIFAFNLLITTSVQAQSGNRVGNGGNVIVCPGKPLQMLDLYEGKVPSKKFSDSPYSMAEKIILPLEKLDPKSYQTFKKKITAFSSNVEWGKEIILSDVKDSLHLAISKGCSLNQIAIRKVKQPETETLFIVNEELWKKMDVQNQAVLVLHEVIYDHFYLLGETDSRKVRALVGELMSGKVDSWSKSDYWNWMKQHQVPIYP